MRGIEHVSIVLLLYFLLFTGLHIAAKYGVTDGCQYLVEVAGVNGNVLDNFEQTAIFYSIESQSLLCSEYLLSIGCSANHRNKDQRRYQICY